MFQWLYNQNPFEATVTQIISSNIVCCTCVCTRTHTQKTQMIVFGCVRMCVHLRVRVRVRVCIC